MVAGGFGVDAEAQQDGGQQEQRGEAGIGGGRAGPGPGETDRDRAAHVGGPGRRRQQGHAAEDEVAREDAGLEPGRGGGFEGADGGREEGDGEEGGQRRGGIEAGDGGEGQGEGAEQGGGAQHDGAAVVPVGEVAADQDQRDTGDGLDEAEQADEEGLAGELEDLVAEQDGHGRGGETLGDVGGHEEAELAQAETTNT